MTTFVAHLVACAFMTGVIWIIQIVHYPAFLEIDETRFTEFHQNHSQRMGFIVGPVMIFELVTALWLSFKDPRDTILIINLIFTALTWVCTFALSVPLHNSLGRQIDIAKIQKLVRTNWPRTFLWSTRTSLLVWWFYAAAS